MLKDRQEIFVLGELMLFLAAWGLGVAAAVDDYRVRTNSKSANNVAAKADFFGTSKSRPCESEQRESERGEWQKGDSKIGKPISGPDESSFGSGEPKQGGFNSLFLPVNAVPVHPAPIHVAK